MKEISTMAVNSRLGFNWTNPTGESEIWLKESAILIWSRPEKTRG
jgi:hypothetical protein